MAGKVGLSTRGREILARLRVDQDVSGLDGAGLPADLLGAMLRHGLLEEQSDTALPADHQDIYVGWKSQRGMLIDHARTVAFHDAIAAVVRPGDHVIDVGTGSGILAMMSARQGASAVWALEFTAMADWAARIAKRNGLDAVRVVRGDGGAFESDRPVDVIVSEFAGMYLIDEWRHYAAFVKARERNLRPGGAVIPRAGRLFLSAVDSRKFYRERGYGFWEAPVYGFDYSDVLASEVAAPRRHIVSADHTSLVCTREVAAFDFLTGTERDFLFAVDLDFDYPAAGSLHGFVGHFELDMAPGLMLGTGTGTQETHWHQSYFPLPAMQIPAGGRVAARLRTFLSPDGDLICLGITVAGPDEELDASPGDGAGRREHVFVLE